MWAPFPQGDPQGRRVCTGLPQHCHGDPSRPRAPPGKELKTFRPQGLRAVLSQGETLIPFRLKQEYASPVNRHGTSSLKIGRFIYEWGGVPTSQTQCRQPLSCTLQYPAPISAPSKQPPMLSCTSPPRTSLDGERRSVTSKPTILRNQTPRPQRRLGNQHAHTRYTHTPRRCPW